MAPNDMLGLVIAKADIVVTSLEDSKLCFGVVTAVHFTTGSIDVKTVVMDRQPAVLQQRLLFPTSQVLVVTSTFKHIFANPQNPEHTIILDLHKEHGL